MRCPTIFLLLLTISHRSVISAPPQSNSDENEKKNDDPFLNQIQFITTIATFPSLEHRPLLGLHHPTVDVFLGIPYAQVRERCKQTGVGLLLVLVCFAILSLLLVLPKTLTHTLAYMHDLFSPYIHSRRSVRFVSSLQKLSKRAPTTPERFRAAGTKKGTKTRRSRSTRRPTRRTAGRTSTTR